MSRRQLAHIGWLAIRAAGSPRANRQRAARPTCSALVLQPVPKLANMMAVSGRTEAEVAADPGVVSRTVAYTRHAGHRAASSNCTNCVKTTNKQSCFKWRSADCGVWFARAAAQRALDTPRPSRAVDLSWPKNQTAALLFSAHTPFVVTRGTSGDLET